MAEWLNAAVSKTVYGYSPYEGSNPSSSAIMHLVNEPEWLVFCMSTMGHAQRELWRWRVFYQGAHVAL